MNLKTKKNELTIHYKTDMNKRKLDVLVHVAREELRILYAPCYLYNPYELYTEGELNVMSISKDLRKEIAHGFADNHYISDYTMNQMARRYEVHYGRIMKHIARTALTKDYIMHTKFDQHFVKSLSKWFAAICNDRVLKYDDAMIGQAKFGITIRDIYIELYRWRARSLI